MISWSAIVARDPPTGGNLLATEAADGAPELTLWVICVTANVPEPLRPGPRIWLSRPGRREPRRCPPAGPAFLLAGPVICRACGGREHVRGRSLAVTGAVGDLRAQFPAASSSA